MGAPFYAVVGSGDCVSCCCIALKFLATSEVCAGESDGGSVGAREVEKDKQR